MGTNTFSKCQVKYKQIIQMKNYVLNKVYNLLVKVAYKLRRFELFRKMYVVLVGNGSVEYHVCDHCNLNCKCCSHFSPISERRSVTLEETDENFRKLSQNYNVHYKTIRLLGGEPLLHPQINNIIQIVRGYFPTKEIQIFTNGILLLKQDDTFFDTVIKNNIQIRVTRYPCGVNYDEIKTLLDEKGVNYFFTSFRSSIDKFEKRLLFEKGGCNWLKNYLLCEQSFCHQLRDGKIYLCPYLAYSDKLNTKFGAKFKHEKCDYIDISKHVSRWDVLWKFGIPGRACRYCDRKGIETIDWEHSKRIREEWVK